MLPTPGPSSTPSTLKPTEFPSSNPSAKPLSQPTWTPTSLPTLAPTGQLVNWATNVGGYYWESAHPYANSVSVSSEKTIIAAGVLGYLVVFSQYTATEAVYDVFQCLDGTKAVMWSNSGSSGWGSQVILTTNGINFFFTPDSNTNAWGWYLVIYPICTNGYYFNSAAS